MHTKMSKTKKHMLNIVESLSNLCFLREPVNHRWSGALMASSGTGVTRWLSINFSLKGERFPMVKNTVTNVS